jgi:hypothetical protein
MLLNVEFRITVWNITYMLHESARILHLVKERMDPSTSDMLVGNPSLSSL